ncbi:MAG: hypothetical protein ABIT01_21160, partial [Thermoanaerobaculia bacterium]
MLQHTRLRRLALSLSLIGAAATLAPAVRGERGTEVTRTVPLDADGSLTLKTYKGSVTVTTGTAAQVQITARIEPDGDDEGMAESVKRTRVEIEGGGRSLRIESNYSRVKSQHSFFSFNFGNSTLPFVHYTIVMPRTAHLVVDDYKSRIRIADLKADLKLETYKGSVRIDRLEGKASLTTYKGEVHADLARVVGTIDLSTYKGTFVV